MKIKKNSWMWDWTVLQAYKDLSLKGKVKENIDDLVEMTDHEGGIPIAEAVELGDLNSRHVVALQKAYKEFCTLDPVPCSFCGTMLVNQDSIRAGMGPICRSHQ